MLVNAWKLKYKVSKKKVRKRSKGYRIRAFSLSELGYTTYDQYLASEDWKLIRGKVLGSFPSCLLCQAKASQVHHLDYDAQVLLGVELRLLASLCDRCHLAIEFHGREKRTLAGANKELRRLARRTKVGRAFLRNLDIVADLRKEKGMRLGPAFDHARMHRKGKA